MLQGKTVFIVDDSGHQRKKLMDMYQLMGLKPVGEASNGMECLKKLSEMTPPDFISLDVIMPVMHGLETLEYLKKQNHPSHIVLMTALHPEMVGKSLTKYEPRMVFCKTDKPDFIEQELIKIVNGERINHRSGDIIETHEPLKDMAA